MKIIAALILASLAVAASATRRIVRAGVQGARSENTGGRREEEAEGVSRVLR
ncbi:MAG: hypothetical protein ABMA01_16355 [Chthoniobacteraceae bacterium]